MTQTSQLRLLPCWMVIALAGALAAVAVGSPQRDSSEKTGKSNSDQWVTEIKPGVRLYGKEPEFAEIGAGGNFDISPDGRAIAFTQGQKIKLIDIEERKEIGKFDISDQISSFEFTPDGRLLVVTTFHQQEPVEGEQAASPENMVQVWDAVINEKITEFAPGSFLEPAEELEDSEGVRAINYIQTTALSADGEKIAVGYGRETIVCDLRSGERIGSIKHSSHTSAISFLAGAKEIVDSTGTIFDVDSGEETGKVPMKRRNFLNTIKLHPKQNMLAMNSWRQGTSVYDLENEEFIDLEKPDTGRQWFYQLQFSNNGKLLAAATYSNGGNQPKLVVWDLKSRKIVNQFQMVGGYLSRLKFGADSRTIYTKAQNEVGLTSWDLENDSSDNDGGIRPNKTPIERFSFSPDADFVIASSAQAGGVMFDVESGKPEKAMYSQQGSFLASTARFDHVIVAARQGSFRIYDMQSDASKSVRIKSYAASTPISRLGGLLRGTTQRQFESYVTNDVVVADDDEHVYVACRGQRSFRWEKFRLGSAASESQKRFRMSNFWEANSGNNHHYWQPQSLTIAANGQWLAIVNQNNDVFIIDAESKVLLHELTGVGGIPCRLQFTPDSERLLVTVGSALRIFDVDSGEQLESIDNLGENPSIALSRGGQRLASIGRAKDSRLKVWQLEPFEKVFSQKVEGRNVSVGISDDGQLVAVGKANCQFEIYDLDQLENK